MATDTAAASGPLQLSRSIERVARARFALPLVLLLAGLAMLVNEITYQHTTRTLAGGIALTDARLQAAHTLQALTELEAAARASVATRHEDHRQRFEQAARTLPQVQDKALALVAQLDGGRDPAAGERLRTQIDTQVRRLRIWVEGGGPAAAFDDAGQRARSAELARGLDQLLEQAASAQQQARLSLYDAFSLNRLAVHGLILLAVLALVLFQRQLRRADAQRSVEHGFLESQIEQRTAELRDLARHLVTAREDERASVARELHDEMGGQLTALKLDLARLKRVPGGLPDSVSERLGAIDKRLNESIALKRRIIENLHPSSLDQLGLNAALQMLCADTAAVAGIPVHAQLQPVAVDKDTELSLYRVTQESLTNVLKYAQATEVWVTLEPTLALARLTVQDDGRGFDPAAVGPGRHGILGMRLRIEAHGGRLDVRSVVGTGTQVIAQMPLARSCAAAA